MAAFTKFKGFAEETKLHGVLRTTEGSNASIVFWTVLAIVCVSMAINDLRTLVSTYQSEPTAVQMSLASMRKDFNWTTPTLCMEMVAQYIAYDDSTYGMHIDNPWLSKNISAAIAAMMWEFNEKVSVDNYTEIRYGNKSADVGITENNNLYYSYMVLGYLIDLERQLMNQSRLNDYQFSLAVNDEFVDERVQLFYDELYRQNVSMGTLTQLVGMWFCLQQVRGNENPLDPTLNIYGHLENYRYFGDPQYINLPICKVNMITHLGFGMVCSKLFETDYVPLKPKYNYYTLYDTRMTQQGGDWFTGSPYATVVPNLLFHLDLQGRNVIPNKDHTNIFSWNPTENVVLDIFVSAEYQFLNTKKRKCSASPVSQADCIWKKRVEYVHQTCGCWPSLSDILNPRNDVNCTSKHLGNISAVNIDKLCPNLKLTALDLSGCVPDCHLLNYSFTQHRPNRFPYAPDQIWARTYNPVTEDNVIGSFEFRFGADSHPFVTEYYTTKTSDFLGLFGGSIGTWLGASLLAFVHIVVYILEQCCFRGSNDKPAEGDEMQMKNGEQTNTRY